jgi:MoxR-like ATPase
MLSNLGDNRLARFLAPPKLGAMAWLEGRDYVSPDDVRNIAFDVLRHRILLTFEAEAEGLTADAIIQRLIDRVPVTA